MSVTPAAVRTGEDSWAIYRRLLQYAKPHAGVFMIGVAGMILFAAMDASLAFFMKYFFDITGNGGGIKDTRALWAVPIGIVVIFGLRGIGDYMSNYFPGWVGRQVVKGVRRDVFSHYLRLPTAYLDTQQSGHLLSKLTYNIELVADAATNASISLIRDSVTIVLLVGTLFYWNWRLACFCIAAAPVIGWLMQITNRSFRRYSTRIQNSMGDITRVAKEAIDALRLIKIFNAEDHQAGRFETANEHNRASMMKLSRAKAVSNPVVQMLAAIALAGVLYVAISQVFAGQMSQSVFMGFLTSALLIPAPLRRLVQISGPLQQGIAAGHSVFELLDHPTEGEGGPRALPRARGEADRMTQEANAYKEQVVNVARGEIQSFLSVYETYRQAKDVTAWRMYMDSMDQLLRKSGKVIIDSSGKGLSGIVPYMPLSETRDKSTPPAGAVAGAQR